MSDAYQPFRRAAPVWLAGSSEQMVVQCGWRAVVAGGRRARLRVATSGVYRLTVDGAFTAHGPARAAHDRFRVDEIDLALPAGERVVALEVCGYVQDSYWLTRQPSFVQAEIESGGEIVAATGARGDAATAAFAAVEPRQRLRRVRRYSMQRVAVEAYALAPGWDAWRRDASWRGAAAATETLPPRALLRRAAPPAAYATRAARPTALGELRRDAPPQKPRRYWWLDRVPAQLAGVAEADLESDPLMELQAKPTARIAPADALAPLADHGFAVLDLGANLTGFLGVRVRCATPCRVVVGCDELATATGDVDLLRMDCVNAFEWRLQPGEYDLETLEPYTSRFLKVIALDGACVVERAWLRGYVNGEAERARFACSDPRLARVFEAARATFAQNAVDLFTDCPSRERAGWLCDSFFTGRAAPDFCGTTGVEHDFLENFILPERFPHLPAGMLPMCYPADHGDGNFIPNWAMWFVLELEEYLARSADRALVEAARPRVRALIEYLGGFRNADGLLEKLPKWVFVEWSKANELVQDVNYPSNMLWAGMLDAAARLYDERAWADEAARVRQTVRAQSFDGAWFVDNAVRKDGALVSSGERTEVCQYFAFFFGVADAQRDAGLWRRLVDEFGPDRRARGLHREIHHANAFIGNFVRLELLSRAGLARRVLDESLGYFLGMAERTGTLWENDTPTASCDHGFAAHMAHAYYRDVLGLAAIDRPSRRLTVRLHDHALAWCEGRVPVGGDDAVELAWWRDGATLRYRLSVPAGWTVAVENRTGGPVAPG